MMKETLKETARAILLVVYGAAFLVILYQVAVHGGTFLTEPNPLILQIELLTAAVALVLGLEVLLKTGKKLSEHLARRMGR